MILMSIDAQTSSQSTAAVLLTPPGRGAVATVLVAGPGAIDIVAALFSPHSGFWPGPDPCGKIRFGRWQQAQGEEVVVAVLDPLRVEVHCHGGLAAPQAILGSLAARGCELPDWQSWLAADLSDSIRAEAVQALALRARSARRPYCSTSIRAPCTRPAAKSLSGWPTTTWSRRALSWPNCSAACRLAGI